MSQIDAVAHLRAALLTTGSQLALAEAGRLASNFLHNVLNSASLPPDVDGRLRAVAHEVGTIVEAAAAETLAEAGGAAPAAGSETVEGSGGAETTEGSGAGAETAGGAAEGSETGDEDEGAKAHETAGTEA